MSQPTGATPTYESSPLTTPVAGLSITPNTTAAVAHREREGQRERGAEEPDGADPLLQQQRQDQADEDARDDREQREAEGHQQRLAEARVGEEVGVVLEPHEAARAAEEVAALERQVDRAAEREEEERDEHDQRRDQVAPGPPRSRSRSPAGAPGASACVAASAAAGVAVVVTLPPRRGRRFVRGSACPDATPGAPAGGERRRCSSTARECSARPSRAAELDARGPATA